jgi:hypothetical protein
VSDLRLAGLAVAAALLAVGLRGHARRLPTASDAVALLGGVALAAAAADPGLVGLAAALLHLPRVTGSRLLALLVYSNLALWPYIVWADGRRRHQVEGLDRQLEALLGRLAAQTAPERLAPVVVVIPARDEEATVADVVREVPAAVAGLATAVVVVADGCRDATAERARRAGAVVLELPFSRGSGSAIRVGYQYAVRAGARVVVTMDADGQHRGEDLAALVTPLLAGEAAMVIGSRRLGRGEHVSALRSLGLRTWSALLSLLLLTRLTDCSSGFRAFDARCLPYLPTAENQYHTAETIIRVRRLGLRIVEVPITIRRRRAGRSKKGSDLIYGYRFARVLLFHWLHG